MQNKILITTATIILLAVGGFFVYNELSKRNKKKIEDEGFDIYVEEDK